jgi:hypothetical protein
MTHFDGCWDAGPKHYECAVTRIRALEQDRDRLREALTEITDGPWDAADIAKAVLEHKP